MTRPAPARLSGAPGLFALLVLAGLTAAPAAAAEGISGLSERAGGAGAPLVIDADDGIEWRKDQQVYIARGNARAVRGDITVEADTLVAHYRDDAVGKKEIWRVNADGNVRITSAKQHITGDNGVYNVDTGIFHLTGRLLRLESPDEVVTARDRLEYRTGEQVAVVTGDATAVRGDKTIRADRFIAYFGQNEVGETVMRRVDAEGNVIITTPTEVARSHRGTYDAKTGVARLTGGVMLTRGDNQLNGEYAEVDLNTGVSRLLAGPEGAAGRRRVRGLFMPREGEESPLATMPGPDPRKAPGKGR